MIIKFLWNNLFILISTGLLIGYYTFLRKKFWIKNPENSELTILEDQDLKFRALCIYGLRELVFKDENDYYVDVLAALLLRLVTTD